MKRMVAVLLILGLAGCAGCGEDVTQPEPSTAQTTEQTTVPAPPVTLPEGYDFASYYATTPTHFYAVVAKPLWGQRNYSLHKASLESIGEQEPIDLPTEHEGRTEYYTIRICGVSPQGLYVYCWDGDWKNYYGAVYCVPHDSGPAELLLAGEDIQSPWYNAGGNSLLYYRSGEHPKMEALLLDSGERLVVFEEEDLGSGSYDSDIWYNLADGSVAMEVDFGEYDLLHFDARNQAQPKALKDDRFISTRDFTTLAYLTNDEISHAWTSTAADDCTSCGDWLYFVEGSHFYRMKPGGTEKTLLREYTHIRQLASVGDALLALAEYDQGITDSMPVSDVMLHLLNTEGKVLETIVREKESDNNNILMTYLADMILLSNFAYGGSHSRHFLALYDPATGIVFS